MIATREAGSFRDPSGTIYTVNGNIYRTVMPCAVDDYEFVRDTNFLKELIAQRRVIATDEVDPDVIGEAGRDAQYVLQHERLNFISYPYEWTFPLLKSAALAHLDIQLDCLEKGIILSDASAYNVQFRGVEPVFIDALSFRRYKDNEFWFGHSQFCEQFLNPLLLRAFLGQPHNSWYRGHLEGIPTDNLKRLLTWRHKLSRNVLMHVVLPANLQKTARTSNDSDLSTVKQAGLPYAAHRNMLMKLHKWIGSLQPKDTGPTVWGNYAKCNTYDSDEMIAKRNFVAEFIVATRPDTVWDIGCNTGDFSQLSLESGAQHVVGFDFDQGALETAYARAQAKQLDYLPIYLDAANPSPNQGWNGTERMGMEKRSNADAVICLAFVHHLAIGKNIPLDQVVEWIMRLAPKGVIEFVDKADPTVRQMLAIREDIFPDYTLEAFIHHISRSGKVLKSEQVSGDGRHLVWFERSISN
jgi:ribosomal protein L11 methylase PrmA